MAVISFPTNNQYPHSLWITDSGQSNIKLSVTEARCWQIHTNFTQTLPLGFVNRHSETKAYWELSWLLILDITHNRAQLNGQALSSVNMCHSNMLTLDAIVSFFVSFTWLLYLLVYFRLTVTTYLLYLTSITYTLLLLLLLISLLLYYYYCSGLQSTITKFKVELYHDWLGYCCFFARCSTTPARLHNTQTHIRKHKHTE